MSTSAATPSRPHFVELADGGRVLVRPVTPDDEPAMVRLLERASREEIRLRFFRSIRVFSHELTAALVRPDDGYHLGVVALPAAGEERIVASAMLAGSNLREAEFAVLVDHDYAHRGLGRHLLECLLAGARNRGIARMFGLVLRENTAMRVLAQEMGATLRADPEDAGCMLVEWTVAPAGDDATSC